MIFPTPKNATEMLLNVWKIVDLPSILKSDLIFKISFELFLISPEKANSLIDRAIQSKILIITPKGHVKISQKLEKQLIDWQLRRKKEISENLIQKKNRRIKKGAPFNTLLNFFTDKGTIARAVGISSSNFDVIDFSKGAIAANVVGTEKEPYLISINTQDKILKHNCRDFETRTRREKMFCKHLVKLFFILKEKNQEQTEQILIEIGENLEDWDFIA